MIRHGQYHDREKHDADRILTEKGIVIKPVLYQAFVLKLLLSYSSYMLFPGRRQAALTGKRLAALYDHYDVIINSTMTRATETADIIANELGMSDTFTKV